MKPEDFKKESAPLFDEINKCIHHMNNLLQVVLGNLEMWRFDEAKQAVRELSKSAHECKQKVAALHEMRNRLP